ncbi:MAG: hypothetical protein R2818_08445 [Flavobacteriales bacterium]
MLLHLKKNHLLLFTWLLLFGYITENIGVKYGILPLPVSGVFRGRGLPLLCDAGSRSADSSRRSTCTAMPCTATVPVHRHHRTAFLKFNINNAVIPGVFVITFLLCSGRFQYQNELVPLGKVLWHLTGFVFGILLFLSMALLYFTRTNTDIIKMLGREPDEYRPTEPLVDIIGPQHAEPPKRRVEQRKASRWLQRQQRSEKWRVDTYLTPRLRIMLARSSAHYDKELLRDVLWQNHINGSIFEVVLVISFIALGAFSDFASSPFLLGPACSF